MSEQPSDGRSGGTATESIGSAGASTRDEGCCEGVTHALSDRDVDVDVETLAAVSNRTRYEALRLVAAAEGGVCGCEVEPALDVSQGAISQALSRLHDAGLLTRRKEGRWRYYDVTPRAERLLAVLDGTRPTPDTGSEGRS
ncbi:ArsR family transcriptional regulator [Halorubrum aidingense JCM 13560]|uniref:ArsR family transcriptional regulator n=1 Tax=Halorubrum aidingense JCM 13560 TaxID=1230454 RepID=M0PG69_9EURY|nr:metalloregulator ArsR/SmtB family transcription factor [Halorubrum aidingense]EMA69082.1 ArsR family transcriptional regulator [Halorubrum aidingense JCM 13560]